jgi:hypothetical protein
MMPALNLEGLRVVLIIVYIIVFVMVIETHFICERWC